MFEFLASHGKLGCLGINFIVANEYRAIGRLRVARLLFTPITAIFGLIIKILIKLVHVTVECDRSSN